MTFGYFPDRSGDIPLSLLESQRESLCTLKAIPTFGHALGNGKNIGISEVYRRRIALTGMTLIWMIT